MKKDNPLTKVIKKRFRKKVSTSEFYKSEMPEHRSAAIEATRSTVTISFILVIILKELSLPIFPIFLSFMIPFFFWKICQTAQSSWTKLNKLHKIIKEEKFEIEHHRPKERKELEILYRAKGFSGKLLEDVLDVLMSDDNRLLQVMMEEEMGLTLSTYEHPLKQGIFAGIGVIVPTLFLYLSLVHGESYYEFFFIGGFINILTSALSFKRSKENLSFIIVWNLAILSLISLISLFTVRFIKAL